MLIELCTGSREPNNQSASMTRIFFMSKYESYHMDNSILIEENKKKNKIKLGFLRALKCSYVVLKVFRGPVTN